MPVELDDSKMLSGRIELKKYQLTVERSNKNCHECTNRIRSCIRGIRINLLLSIPLRKSQQSVVGFVRLHLAHPSLVQMVCTQSICRLRA